jgi:hypothetical protein
VLAAVVEMSVRVPARFVAEKLNGPPGSTVVTFWMATKGIAGLTILVKVQTSWALARIAVAGIVSTLPARVPMAPVVLPDAAALLSTQLAAVIVKFVVVPSVMVTAVPFATAETGASDVG